MQHAAERDEIGRIDYFLDHLARAVERGEVHRASYDILAPRYLERRADLIAIVMGGHARAGGTAVGGTQVPPGVTPAAAAGDAPAGRGVPTAVAAARPMPARPAPKPVQWTTVLLFLGAFLVIVASAIFTFAVWDLLPVAGKFGFLAAVTVAFYVGGWWSRAKLQLRSGSVALTSVASALLLFDGWVLIDGYDLTGPLPWAALLFVCSAVYWYTEVRLAERFFGVIGAAGQIGWWWLLGEGLGWAAPARLAGLAVIAVLWHVTAQRGRGNATVGSLAVVLGWAAPVLEVLVLVGVLVDLAFVRSAGTTEVLCAAVVVVSAGVVAWRGSLLPAEVRRWVAAAVQLPLFAAAWVAAVTTGDSWWLIAVFALAALTYDTWALLRAGAPFAVVGLLAEASLVIEACRFFEASPAFTLGAVALLAAVWSSVPRLVAATTDSEENTPTRAVLGPIAETARVARWGAVAVLVGCSIAVPIVQGGVALLGVPLDRVDALLALVVFVAWLAAAVVTGGMTQWAGAAAFSVYAAGSLAAWTMPAEAPGVYGLVLIVVLAAWLFASRLFDRREDAVLGPELRWSARMALVIVTAMATLVEIVRPWPDPPPPPAGFASPLAAALLLTAAVVLALDARIFRSRVAAALAAVFAVPAARLATSAAFGYLATGSGAAALAAARESSRWLVAPAAGLTGAAVAAGAWWAWRRAGSASAARCRRAGHPLDLAPDLGIAQVLVVVAPLVATVAAAASLEDAGTSAAGLLLAAIAWAFAAAVVSPWLILGSCATLIAALSDRLAGIAGPPWITLLAFAAVGFALSAPSLLRRADTARRRSLFDALAIGGLGAHVVLVLLGLDSYGGVPVMRPAWNQIGDQGMVIALLVLAVHLLAHAARRDFEPAYYPGFGLVVLALWAEFGALEVVQAEAFTTPLALYLVGCGALFAHMGPGRRHPIATDIGAVVVGLGYPLLLALRSAPAQASLVHSAWVLGLSLVAIGAGIAVKSRWFLFGGAGALSAVALYRSFTVLAEVWWLVLGLVGVALLVIALTWERQRMIVSDTRERLRRSFEDWR